MEKLRPHSPAIRNLFFMTGILATTAYRVIVVLNNYSALWVSIAWYFGTIGFIIYFSHRYQISEKRSRLIKKHQLVDKVKSIQNLNEEEREALEYIVRTLKSTKEKWNYIFIFVMSGLALVVGIVMDIISFT